MPLRRFRRIGGALKLNCAHQLLLCAGANLLAESIHAVNTEASLGASKEVGLGVDEDKTEHMFIAGEQNSGPNRDVKIRNKSCESVAELRYLETTRTLRNCFRKERKKRSNSCYAYCHFVQWFTFPFAVQKYKD